jgi:hypothetical protein
MGSLLPQAVPSWLPGARRWLLGTHLKSFAAKKLEAPSGLMETLLPSDSSIDCFSSAGPNLTFVTL